ncbi:MAG TPA: twin-arginine translocase TatA/TatE family subunit [Ilumatobacter sp.]|nr:twin-arginine translocase TatA/TatE family subunit [Ilumatobacter sp.]
MFNLQGSELMIILLLALVVLGPEKLPDAMRKMGKMYGELKRMSSGFQDEFRSAVDEPMREFRKAVDEPMNELRSTANTLRDSADFRRFEAGERGEKPKSGDMASITDSADLLSPADSEAIPVADTPSFRPDDGSDPDPRAEDAPTFPVDPQAPQPQAPQPGAPNTADDSADALPPDEPDIATAASDDVETPGERE